MKLSSLCLLSAIVVGCSQSVSVTQLPPTTARIITDTINFGALPVWRQMDTTVILALKSKPTTVATTLLDSNWAVLRTERLNDSTLVLNIRYRPRSVAKHAGALFVSSKTDSIACVALIGNTKPFERRIGDTYSFLDGSGTKFDVTVTGLPDSFSCSVWGEFPLSTIRVDNSGNWLLDAVACGSVGTKADMALGRDTIYNLDTLPFQAT
jgi:hypothetical protein